MEVDKRKVIGIVIILIAIASIFFFTLPKNCKQDASCFDSSAAKCSKAKVTTFNNDSEYYYEVLGVKGNNCLIDVKLLTLSQTNTPEMKQALEGKSMTCSIPKERLQSKSIKEIEDLNNFCSGQLKEATLEITVEKLYEIIVKNIGPVALEFQRGLTQH